MNDFNKAILFHRIPYVVLSLYFRYSIDFSMQYSASAIIYFRIQYILPFNSNYVLVLASKLSIMLCIENNQAIETFLQTHQDLIVIKQTIQIFYWHLSVFTLIKLQFIGTLIFLPCNVRGHSCKYFILFFMLHDINQQSIVTYLIISIKLPEIIPHQF